MGLGAVSVEGDVFRQKSWTALTDWTESESESLSITQLLNLPNSLSPLDRNGDSHTHCGCDTQELLLTLI